MPNEGVVGGPEQGGMGKLFEALSKAQHSMGNAKKSKENPFFRSSYADLAAVWDACREALTANGLSVVQTMEDGESGLFLVTTLGHSSGQYMASRMAIKPTKQDPQGVGSALTYARRYALSAIVGVATEDDDGNAASAKEAPAKARSSAAKAQATASIPVCPVCEVNSQVVQAQKDPAKGAWGCLRCKTQFDVQD